MNMDFDTVIDIGANVGKFSKEIKKTYPNVAIFAFEPLENAYKKMVNEFHGDYSFVGFNVALGDVNGSVPFYHSSRETSSSVLKMGDLHKVSFPDSADAKIENVSIVRLDDLIQENNIVIGESILTKIDVQGYEYDVLLGGKSTLSKSKIIICEVSFFELYENQKLFEDILVILSDWGFRFCGMLSQIHHPKSGAVLQANAMFMNMLESNDNT